MLWGIGIVFFIAAFIGAAVFTLLPRLRTPAPPTNSHPLGVIPIAHPVYWTGSQLMANIHVGDSLQSVNAMFGSAGSMMAKTEDGSQSFMYTCQDGHVLLMADASDHVKSVIWIRKDF